MACKTSYELHHHFPKLADESGFTFNSHRPRVLIDWNKIKFIDIESLIRERKFVLIEQHINDILDCVLESEFDVRILDDGVLKMFRLAQLTVEYQQFCRHYLDRSVYVLRQEINSLAQDLDTTKKNLQEKEEELRKFRKRTRHTYKTPLPYGNDNIATMILRTLNNRGDLYATTSRGDLDPYNKCKYCEKIFLNQLYLQSHLSRRHANQMDLPEKETNNESHIKQQNDANGKLNTEIMELKNKLKEMETLIANFNKQDKSPVHKNSNNNDNVNQTIRKYMKDAEVSTNNDDYLLNKIEEWKKEEHEKYNKEINILRDQITETINSFKQNETKSEEKDSNMLAQLRSTILAQGAEIVTLKQELKESEKYTENKSLERLKEAEEQLSFWTKRAEAQSKQYESLLQKLNDLTREAKESRELADSERTRAEQLQTLLLERNNKDSENNTSPCIANNIVKLADNTPKNEIVQKNTSNQLSKKQSPSKSIKITDRETLDNLHRKAQELLNMGSSSSSLSDSSSVDKIKVTSTKPNHIQVMRHTKPKMVNHNKTDSKKEEKNNHTQNITENHNAKIKKLKEQRIKKEKPTVLMNGIVNESVVAMENGSPLKVIRAKLTEEVNSRLAQLGVDPFKSRLSQNIFQRQRVHLQKQQEIKSKKNPSHEKIKYSILAYLDSNTAANEQDCVFSTNKYSFQDKIPKPFRSLTSLISGVKSKAISLVKPNDPNSKEQRKIFGSEVAKRAILLIKTPPGTAPNSPSKNNSSSSKNNNSPVNNSHQRTSTDVNTEIIIDRHKKLTKAGKEIVNKSDSSDSLESNQKYLNEFNVEKSVKGIETIIKSPTYRSFSASSDDDHSVIKHQMKQTNDPLTRTQSAVDLSESKVATVTIKAKTSEFDNYESSDDVKSLSDLQQNNIKPDNKATTKKTKSVLKNACSTSSLKKKVIFDMDAIQMKSLSATPSQSITEKSGNEIYELGLINLDTEEWDISSIENEPLKIDTKLQLTTRTSPKIAELKKTIEAQLARRTDASSGIVGGVDVLGITKPTTKDSTIGGSNTSLGSSILDESDSMPAVNRKAFAVPEKTSEKEDSVLDVSEFSIDGIPKINKKESF